MPIETELKLTLSPENLNKLRHHPFLRKLASGRAVNRKLLSIYYDTPDLRLRNKAMALRLRHQGKQWLQTLKGGGSVQTGLHQRNEWETPVPEGQLDFRALAGSDVPFPHGLKKKLQPVFITDFSRNMRLLHYEGAEIELCLDSGEIRAGKNARQISELELELKSGEPQQLFRLALVLLDIVPLELEQTSKAEHGYRLLDAERLLACKGTFPFLEKSQDISSALHSMIVSCLEHVQANVPGTLLDIDEEFLHQVRVGLRRLRVVLAMAEMFREDEELHELHQEVSGMCIEFGQLREWDVFVTQTLASIREQLPWHSGLAGILDVSETIREHQHAEMVGRLHSKNYQRFLLRFGAWMCGPYWNFTSTETLQDFALRILEKRRGQMARHGSNLRDANVARLHALRIACKKLRYSVEMFSSLFQEGKTYRYLKALSGLQDILGKLNDNAVAHQLLDNMDDKKYHDTLALFRVWLEHDYADQLPKLDKQLKRFSGQKPFWV